MFKKKRGWGPRAVSALKKNSVFLHLTRHMPLIFGIQDGMEHFHIVLHFFIEIKKIQKYIVKDIFLPNIVTLQPSAMG